ncbi:OmpA family protein [Aquimarina addita]|uniref:OmpA family protein n=1 Tax=Aquimarina addita TaxID=870485 RepID=A0ABP6UL21_9FLAO
MMKSQKNNHTWIYLLATLIIVATSCKSLQKAEVGAMVGGTVGAIGGSLIDTGDNDYGTLLGGTLGTALGGYIGSKMDQQVKQIEEELPSVAVEKVEEKIYVVFNESNGVYFDSNKYDLNISSKEALQKFSNILIEYPETKILIAGHTDNVGNDEANLTLSKKRAEAVRDFLIIQGADKDRFTIKYFGEYEPKFTNDTPEGREGNRRVEVTITPNAVVKN